MHLKRPGQRGGWNNLMEEGGKVGVEMKWLRKKTLTKWIDKFKFAWHILHDSCSNGWQVRKVNLLADILHHFDPTWSL